ncbi:MAG: glycosyltransferase family 2 protein [Patescibacteria group bacterium]
MKLSVIVPVYNEEATVAVMLAKLIKVRDVREVLVVNDGSTDKTEKKIMKISRLRSRQARKIKYFKKTNGGKGSAVRFGLKKVTGDFVLIQDADLEYDPDDIPKLLEPIKKGRVKVVYGSRFTGPHSNLLFWHKVGNTVLNLILNVLFNTTLSDMETCYKVMPARLMRSLNLKSNSFDLEPEITCKILKMGIHIYEVPISYVGRDFSEGKKINWVDGIEALGVIFKLRFT